MVPHCSASGFVAASRGLAQCVKCPYQTLGVTVDADEDAIKTAFRRKARELHPDVNRSDPLLTLAFMECQHAYQTLLDPEKRAKYDKTLLPRANSQVLSYLNARSAARYGVAAARVPSRAPYKERPELYGTMLELLQQVKSCAKHLEREVLGKDGRSAALPSAADSRRVVATMTAADAGSECGEHECCEPWLYYALREEGEQQQQTQSRRRRA